MSDHSNSGNAPIPSGTVTFLFTDVEGSTRLWQDHPREMGASLARHDEILRYAIETNLGYVFSTAGDAFAAAFTSAQDAVSAATSAQQALGTESWNTAKVQVRMGVHTGVAEERGGDYFGPVLNRAARIMSLAGGSQLLVSSATHELVADALASTFAMIDLGEHKLKSLSQPERIFQVMGTGLAPERLQLITENTLGNLPRGTAEFIGRADDIEELGRRVEPARLVTLTGIGGAGKTQLSLKVAATLAAAYPDGVWWCDLTPLSAPEGIPSAVASALGFMIQASADPLADVVEALAHRRIVLVMDNCEHLLDGVAPLLDAVLNKCPGVALIATSREPIGLGNELVWPIRALDPESEAIALLIGRAVSADATLEPDKWNHDDLVELCEQLDGIPLAIEMAAARLRSLSPRQIIERLDDRFRSLRSRRRDGTDRHRTLLTMLDWSYNLLERDEQLLLDRLSVFSDTFDIEAAESICFDHEIDELDIADHILALVDKSLVTTVRTTSRPRFRLLETVRHYGLAHLDAAGQTDNFRRRHAHYYCNLASDAHDRMLGHEVWSGLAEINDNWSDIVAALAWSIDEAESTLTGRLFHAVSSHATGLATSEIGELARRAVGRPSPPAIAYGLAGFYAESREQVILCETGLALPELTDSDRAALFSQLAAGRSTSSARGVLDAIRGALLAARGAGSPTHIAYWEAITAEALAVRSPEVAAEHAAVAYRIVRDWPNHPTSSAALGRLASYEVRHGRLDQALELARKASTLADGAAMLVFRDQGHSIMARIAAVQRADDAPDQLREVLAATRDARWWYNIWPLLSDAGRWFAVAGNLGAAAVVDAHFETGSRPRAFDIISDRGIDLSDEHESRRLGEAMTADELVQYVLDELTLAGESRAETS